MKKFFSVLISLAFLPNLAYELTDEQKYVLGICGVTLVCAGACYYAHRSFSAQALEKDTLPGLVSNETDKSENDQNHPPQQEIVRHQKIYGQSDEQREAQKRLQEFFADEAEAFKKQEELKRESVAQQNNKPTQSILSPETSNPESNVNNSSSVAKKENSFYRSYCEKVSEKGWDY